MQHLIVLPTWFITDDDFKFLAYVGMSSLLLKPV